MPLKLKTPSSNPTPSSSKWIVWVASVLIAFCTVYNFFLFALHRQSNVGEYLHMTADAILSLKPWAYDAAQDADNYGLSDEQCNAAFPDLFRHIDEYMAALEAPLTYEETTGPHHWCEARAMLYDNRLYMLEDWFDPAAEARKLGTLYAINRAVHAVASTGRRFPNIEFVLATGDKNVDISRPTWAYNRMVTDNRTILMPDFGLYSWPAHNIGTYPQVRANIQQVEGMQEFRDKIPKLIWRGSGNFGTSVGQALVDASMGKAWSDVETIDWFAADSKNHAIKMHDHCKYQFVAQTEGIAYSGRLKYLHNCESVIIAHEFAWETHDQHLMIASGPEQNYMQVNNDYSDLEAKMDWLISHPEDAARIARNNVNTFRDRYLTPAAEACYWRRLIDEYGRNSFEPQFYKIAEARTQQWRGLPFETFALTRKMVWDEHHGG